MNKQIRLVSGIVVLSIVFVGIVPIIDIISTLFYPSEITSNSGYDIDAVIAGIVSETVRAWITIYLYSNVRDCGSSLKHGVQYGLLFSALIASLYILLGGFYFRPADPWRFVIIDSVILFVQGIFSGLVLFRFFGDKKQPSASIH